MTWSLGRFIVAVAIAILVGIVLVGLVGPFLVTLKNSLLTTIGDFCENYGILLGVIAGVLYYFGVGYVRRVP